jgi:hypothetical protein
MARSQLVHVHRRCIWDYFILLFYYFVCLITKDTRRTQKLRIRIQAIAESESGSRPGFTCQKNSKNLLLEIFIDEWSAQTRTGIGLLGKPPTVKQFLPSEANRCTRLLRDPRANAGMKRTSVVKHNLYFAGLAIVG